MTVNEITGITGGSRNAFIGAFKEKYLPQWPDAQNDEQQLLALLGKKTGGMLGGRRALTTVMYNYVQSAGMPLPEDRTAATATAPSFQQLELMARRLQGRVRLTGHAHDAAKAGDSVSYVKPMAEQLRTMRKQWFKNKNRMLHNGSLDIMTTLSATTAASGVCVTVGRNSRTSGADTRWAQGVRQLRVGMSVAFVASAAGVAVPFGNPYAAMTTVANERKILSISPSADGGSFTVGTTADVAGMAANIEANDTPALVIPWGSRSETLATGTDDADADSELYGMNGLGNLVVDAGERINVYGQSRTTYPFLEGIVADESGVLVPWDEDQITLVLDLMADGIYFNDEGVDCSVMDRGVRREFIRDVKGERRFDAVISKRGWGRLQFTADDQPIPIYVDSQCLPQVMHLLSKKSFGYFEETPPHNPDDGERFVEGKDAKELWVVESGNFGNKSPASNGKKEDILASMTALT